eukprot:scaffold17209_cov68-Phaeocystis_antarctica.AAC.2
MPCCSYRVTPAAAGRLSAIAPGTPTGAAALIQEAPPPTGRPAAGPTPPGAPRRCSAAASGLAASCRQTERGGVHGLVYGVV